MIKKLLVLIFLSLAVHTQAQQIPMYNQFHIAPRVYNPSYTGFYDGVDIVLVRNQKWGNFSEGFITNYLSADYLIRQKHGIGINLYSDNIGITSKLKAHLLYSYKITLGEKAFLRAGAGVGVVDNRIDIGAAIVTDPNDPFFSTTNSQGRRTMFDMNAGINFQYYGDKHRLRIGVSVPQTLGLKLAYGDLEGSYYTLERQYLSNIGYTWRISDTKAGGMSLRPEALVMISPGAPIQYNGGLFFEMDKYFWIGGMYKSDYAVGINLGISAVKNLKIGFAYDYQIGATAAIAQAPNVEIMLNYSIPTKYEKGGVDSTLLIAKDNEIDSLKKEIVKRDDQITEDERIIRVRDRYIDSLLTNWPDEVEEASDSSNTGIKTNAPGDFFIELNNSDTPGGYYLIGGAFAEKKNADNLIRKIKRQFPNARIIRNLRNDLYYVMLYYSKDKGEGLAYESYKANKLPDEETWILYYQKPDKRPNE